MLLLPLRPDKMSVDPGEHSSEHSHSRYASVSSLSTGWRCSLLLKQLHLDRKRGGNESVLTRGLLRFLPPVHPIMSPSAAFNIQSSLCLLSFSLATLDLCSWWRSPADDEAPPPPWRGNTTRRYVSSDTRPQPGSATLKLLNIACELALLGVPVC